jgi:mannosyltransferase OCH1-like enzyme
MLKYQLKQMIPKIIHQIWIGPKKRPDIWMDTFRKFCQEFDYEYVLWDDKKVSEMEMENKYFYNLEQTYNGKSDILRYEILYQYGGTYVDADSVLLKAEKFHELLSSFDKDAGFGFEIDGKLACGGVSLAKKHSEFMKKCIEEIPTRNMNLLAWQSIGPQLITDLSIKYQNIIPMTFYKSTIFYPRRWHGIQDIDLHNKVEIPEESVMFQYGYSTNNLETKI